LPLPGAPGHHQSDQEEQELQSLRKSLPDMVCFIHDEEGEMTTHVGGEGLDFPTTELVPDLVIWFPMGGIPVGFNNNRWIRPGVIRRRKHYLETEQTRDTLPGMFQHPFQLFLHSEFCHQVGCFGFYRCVYCGRGHRRFSEVCETKIILTSIGE
jgi:hypothetical protein